MKDFEIRCNESRLEKDHILYGKFTLGPFLPGQGTTFGNALRRSLLAELSGLAITAFEILGVMQEFSTLPGLRESILDLSLNLKQVVLTGILPYSIPPIGFLKIRGPAIIRATDLKLPAGVYCASPTQYIGTLGSNGTLHIKFLISVGKGYSTQPYALYQSLSKVKLQPTRSPKFEQSDTRFFEQREGLRPSLLFNDVKEMENKIFTNSTNINPERGVRDYSYPEGKGQGDRFLNRIDKLEKVPGSIIDRKQKKTERLNDFVSQVETEAGNSTRLTKNESIENSLLNFESINPINKSAKIYPNSVSPSGQGKDQNGINFVDKSLQISNLNDSNPESIYGNNENVTSSLPLGTEEEMGYVDIQTQIFQRINSHQVLPIDAVFTPVSRVNFLTQINDRFETAREDVILEIWTNGSIHPNRALEEATLSLVQNFDTVLKKIQQASSFYNGIRYWTSVRQSDLAEMTNEEPPLSNSRIEIKAPSSYPYPSATAGMGKPISSLDPEGKTYPSVPNPQLISIPLRNKEEANNQPNFASSQHTRRAGFTSDAKRGTGVEVQSKKQEPFKILSAQEEALKVSQENPILRMKAISEKTETEKRGEQSTNPSSLQITYETSARTGNNSILNLHQSIVNLDIGNFHFSLQTFLLLKEAKIQTLSHLLTYLNTPNIQLTKEESIIKNNLLLNEKIACELYTAINQFC